MAWHPGSWQWAGGTAGIRLCRTVLAGTDSPGWELSERSRAQTAGEYLAAFVIPALGCLQLSLGAVLSPLPASAAAAYSPSGAHRFLTPLHGPFKHAGEERPCPPAATAEHLQEPLRQPCWISGESLFLTRHSPRPPPPNHPHSVPPELPFTPLTAADLTAPGCSLSRCPLIPSQPQEQGGTAGTVALDSP